jgi:hypothetical protein
MRNVIPPTTNERGKQTHPAWGMIAAHRVTSHPGAVLFDSDIRHQHYVTIKISGARRQRDLNRDWIGEEETEIEVSMSEAQWASFVSSINTTGVPTTITYKKGEEDIPGMPYEPRLQESMDEVHGATDKAMARVREAFFAYKEKKNVANLRSLEAAIANAPSNMEFAATSLSEHAENVVQRARADIEAMVWAKAERLGIEASDLGFGHPQLTEGE